MGLQYYTGKFVGPFRADIYSTIFYTFATPNINIVKQSLVAVIVYWKQYLYV